MNLYWKIKDLKMNLKHAWQRAYRGFDNTAFWGLDIYLTDIALPVLKQYRERGIGMPWNNKTNAHHTEESWNAELDKMILAFELIKKYEYEMTTEKKDEEKIEEGLQSFAEHFRGLWD